MKKRAAGTDEQAKQHPPYISRLRGWVIELGLFRRYFGKYEFLQDVHPCTRRNPDERVVERRTEAVAATFGVVQIGDGAARQAAQDARVVRLPVAVIAPGYHRP